mmetsp:Transcript_11840/g.26613  ORF Transcript_11840/g.26613 Transcript_11840/m.26613 type:complete len:260 (-) Transcript_11840:128-907(-)
MMRTCLGLESVAEGEGPSSSQLRVEVLLHAEAFLERLAWDLFPPEYQVPPVFGAVEGGVVGFQDHFPQLCHCFWNQPFQHLSAARQIRTDVAFEVPDVVLLIDQEVQPEPLEAPRLVVHRLLDAVGGVVGDLEALGADLVPDVLSMSARSLVQVLRQRLHAPHGASFLVLIIILLGLLLHAAVAQVRELVVERRAFERVLLGAQPDVRLVHPYREGVPGGDENPRSDVELLLVEEQARLHVLLDDARALPAGRVLQDRL